MRELRDIPDGDLWRRAREGQAEAFGVIFDRHAKAVYNHCFRRAGSWSAAEDLTSVVFLEAWRRHADVIIHHESALPWLLGVANHVLRNRRRSLLRHDAALRRLPPPSHPPDIADGVSTRVDGERDLGDVLTAVRRLSIRDQEVISLCVWSGLDYAAAAAALGVPIGTVRSRLARARARLTRSLAGTRTSAEREVAS